MNEVFTARRFGLGDNKRSRLYTTAASLLNFALSHGGEGRVTGTGTRHGQDGSADPVHEGAIVYRHRTAIALYYLSLDEADRTRRRQSPHPPSPSEDPSQHGHHDTPYQRHLQREYPLLFHSGLLQELLLPDKTLAIDVFGEASVDTEKTARVSQDFGETNVMDANSIAIKFEAHPFPRAASTSSLSAQTTVLSFVRPVPAPLSAFHPSARSPNASHINLVVPCYPLLVIDEARSLTRLVKSIETAAAASTRGSLAETVQRYLEHGRHRRNARQGPYDVQALVVKFFNLSHVVRLGRHLVVGSLARPRPHAQDEQRSTAASSLFASYATRVSGTGEAARVRLQVVEALAELERFDEALAVVVAREAAKWPRWTRTTTETDHDAVWVGDEARETWKEWSEVVGWLKILVETNPVEVQQHVAVAR
ncbi:hypothetical protein JCM11491_003541 [Sporobolomyces phaffii]